MPTAINNENETPEVEVESSFIQAEEPEPELDFESRLPGSEVVYLFPEEMEVDEINDRQEDTEEDIAKLQELGESLAQRQIQPCIVEVAENGVYLLHVGRRRRKAAILYNQTHPETPIRLWCVIYHNEQDWQQMAWAENMQRQDYSAIEKALIVKKAKDKLGASGKDWSKQVADYLKVSRAFVTENFKVLSLPKELQDRAAREHWSTQALWIIAGDVKPEKRDEVANLASEKAAKEQAEKVEKAKSEVPDNAYKPEKHKKKIAEVEAEKPSVKTRHVEEAAREVEDALSKSKPRTKKEILSWFDADIQRDRADAEAKFKGDELDAFVSYLIGQYADGTGSGRTLNKRWDAFLEAANNGKFKKFIKPAKK